MARRKYIVVISDNEPHQYTVEMAEGMTWREDLGTFKGRTFKSAMMKALLRLEYSFKFEGMPEYLKQMKPTRKE